MCVEIDLTKPLLSRFQSKERNWRIQYKGFRMIRFHYGEQGHRETMSIETKVQGIS